MDTDNLQHRRRACFSTVNPAARKRRCKLGRRVLARLTPRSFLLVPRHVTCRVAGDLRGKLTPARAGDNELRHFRLRRLSMSRKNRDDVSFRASELEFLADFWKVFSNDDELKEMMGGSLVDLRREALRCLGQKPPDLKGARAATAQAIFEMQRGREN